MVPSTWLCTACRSRYHIVCGGRRMAQQWISPRRWCGYVAKPVIRMKPPKQPDFMMIVGMPRERTTMSSLAGYQMKDSQDRGSILTLG